MNCLKRCLANPKSIWYFIPNHIFDKIGSLSFILKCNYLPSKLPIALSKFHQQCLLAWKLCYVHSFSSHRTCLWNNRDITIRNKPLFFPRWFQNNINCILCLFDDSGNILSYEQFMSYHSFPTPPKEFNKVIKAISPGLIHLVKCHSLFNPRSSVVTRSTLLLEGVDLLD